MKSPMRRVGRVDWTILWLLVSVAAWAVVPALLGNQTLRAYREVVVALPGYLLLGLIVGAATGLGQALAWRLPAPSAQRWLWASVAGYGLAFPAGLILGTLLLSLTWNWHNGTYLFMPLTDPASTTYWPFPGDLVYAGFLAGLCQLSALRSVLDRPTPAMCALWVFGAWLGIGLGLFLGGWSATLFVGTGALADSFVGGLYRVVWGAGWGVTVGLVSTLILWLLRHELTKTKAPTIGRTTVETG
jgi:hypothetical protein